MQDVRSNDSAFIANLGHKPLTFAYPYNSKTSEAIKAVEEGENRFQIIPGWTWTTEKQVYFRKNAELVRWYYKTRRVGHYYDSCYNRWLR